ncbi:hypothetical protein PO883_08005 [Massilia sp. DJPM01]|uniref:hypothetical protein n=1 Tax=Massilia sp. DJPM01 TaxID=3024404 RepID=UPI00259EBD1E|nr:hypothetical protein [Massilia sp. DJPM01]MDM5177138.1 hypothetical protein [Massilia sp. DJPM01]
MLFATWPAAADAAPKAPRRAETIDVTENFSLLAQQRPWICPDQQANDTPRTGWSGGQAECAWQNRLRMRSWSGQGGLTAASCVSAQAHWWVWARTGGAALSSAPPAWRTAWSAHSLVDDGAAEKRIVILRRLANGEWNATEWRWSPSTRAATRRWQEGRWQLLVARAAQLRQAPEPPYGPQEARTLRALLEANLGTRVGEAGSHTWQWKAGGLCLAVDAAGLGLPLMQLPYAVDDSRLEQRAAMQLQLARRYPKAMWLSTFSLVPTAPQAGGGAKFYALWLEGAVLKGQLWIPTRADGPLVRLRITTAVPVAPGSQPDQAVVERARQVVQGELMGLAVRWTDKHD